MVTCLPRARAVAAAKVKMDLPASYYGKLNKTNPVVVAFEREVKSFLTLMRRVASSASRDNRSYARGIKILVEIRKNYKHRLPLKIYEERIIQIADFLFGMKWYQLALWQGYSLHLLNYSSVKITDITDVDHFMACFFPGGFDTDQDIFAMKIRAMQGCVLCIFELQKRHSVLSQEGLCKLLHLLNFIRIMMRAFQQHEHLCFHLYNGSLHIYTICRYLMTVNCSAQAVEYLLWASISLELSIPLMTAMYLPWIATLYCAVCHCYYDNQAAMKAEKFARRALEKINELAKMESDVPATRETQRAYREASIKLAAMVFKRAVFEAPRRPRIETKSTLKDMPNAPWPRTTTERILMGLFDSSAAQFLGILEALDKTRRPLQSRMPDEPELQVVILELLRAGISILSGAASPNESLSALTPTSTLMDLAITGENTVPIMSAMRFVKLLFEYKQPDTFAELAKKMLQVLSHVEGQSFRRAELELALLDSYNSVLTSQRNHAKEDNMTNDKHNSLFSMSDDFIGLADTLHKCVCGSAPEEQPDGDLVVDVLLFLWGKVKVIMQTEQLQNLEFTHYLEKVDNYDKWLWCLLLLCEVAFARDLATVDCIMTVEMAHMSAILLESAAEHCHQTQCQATCEAVSDGVKPGSFYLLGSSRTELLQKVCEVVGRGLEALDKGVAPLLPQDCSAVTDTAFMQILSPLPPSTPCVSSLKSPEEENEDDGLSKKEKEVATEAESDMKESQDSQSTHVSRLAIDLHLELDIIYHRASLKLLQLKAVADSELLDRIKKNKVSKALFLIQKALLVHNNMVPNDSDDETESLIKEAATLIEKAEVEEKKLYHSTTCKTPAENKVRGMREEEESPPPAPVLLSRTDHTFTFAPAPYDLEGEVCWYQICGRTADSINLKVRLGDCSLPGTGNMVPAGSGECVLRVEGLEPNQKYVFAVAAYNSQGMLLGKTIGGTTIPLLASMPIPLLSTWAHLAQVAFQTGQYAIAKRACRELWSHYTYADATPHSTQDRLATTGLRVETLQHSSLQMCQLFFTSIFIETEINIQQGSLYCDSFSDSGPFIWEQEARLAECERLLVAMDLAMWLNDGSAAMQAVVNCYGLLAPLIFHQITCEPVVEVLKKCLLVLEENSDLLKPKQTGNTSDSFLHMIACMTYYLSKALRVLKKDQMASVLMDCGRKLLQEVYDAQMLFSKLPRVASKMGHTAIKGEPKVNLQLRALHWKNKRRITSDGALSVDDEISQPLTGCGDPTILYDLIFSSTLNDAYQNVMKLRRKAYFVEFASLLLQRTMEEGQPDLVLKWGQSMFGFLSRRDKVMGLPTKRLEENSQSKKRSSAQTSNGNKLPQQNRNPPSRDDKRKKLKQNMPHSMLQRVRTEREMRAVENVLTLMSSLVQRHKKQLQLRNVCCEEGVWKSHLNYSMAQAHLALLYQGLDQLHGGALQHRYSQINPLCFSLAYSGIMLWRNSQRQQSSKSERESSHSCVKDYVAAHNDKSKKEAVRTDDSATEQSDEEEEDASETVEQQIEIHRCSAAVLLKSLNEAALHLRRAMVLAHRGGHWTSLQCVCQTVWDQSCRISILVQAAVQREPPCPITAEQLHCTFTPLLVLATDLIMDMLNRLGLWSLYDSDLTEEELECSLHFSGPLDDSTQVDLRWVRTLVLHTLERLHDSGKWESLAHFALVFNSYTRERYALIVTPLLVHAQRRLLERISSYGGPAVPQPHHVRTQRATGNEVTYRSYAGSQVLIGWTPHSAQQPRICKKAALKNSTARDAVNLKGAEMQRSMSLVCVPLDIEDTLSCYRQAVERRPHCLHVFQHSRSLLLLLLADTQPGQLQHCQNRSLSHSASMVDFSPIFTPTPNIQPCDVTQEDYSMPTALYSVPISHDHMPTVTAAYSTSIKYLQANGHDSLRVLALHELGNLQFYNGNTRAAHSCWSKAADCALQSSGAVQKWDGVSFGGGSLQQTLKKAGIWGCLHAAGLTGKIARYILTSDIDQRTKCCLLSAHLFKCVLCCSLAQPQVDLHYASHSIGEELLPGVDLFSEAHRVHLGTTVTSLNFICHWLFTTGYYITLLPILALYLHFVGNVCRDVQRTVEGRILKIRALTELCLFTEAVKESVQLTQGTGVLLPSGQYIAKDNLKPVKTFHSNKSLLDNAEALEELVNCDFAPEVRTLYGSTLCLRFNLARAQLVLALSDTIQGPPVADSVGEACARVTSSSVNSKHHEQERLDTEGSCLNTEEPEGLTLDTEREKLTPERFKSLLLERAFTLLQSTSEQLTCLPCSETENLELTIESKLLRANLYLQQGHTDFSSTTAVSALVLLQMSPVIMRRSTTDSKKSVPDLLNDRTGGQQGTEGCNVSGPLHGDCSREVEASERIGVSLWLRCRLALVHSLAAHIPSTSASFPGKNINEEAAQVLQEGLDESALWGDLDIHALLMVEDAKLKAQRGKIDDSMAMLQDAVSQLSERTHIPPVSTLTLTRATLILSDLRGTQSITLLKLTQKLLQKQLCLFGQSVVLDDGKVSFSPPGPSNIYLPYLSLLDQATLRLGQVSVQSSQTTTTESSHLSNKTERASPAPGPSVSDPNTSSPKTPPCSTTQPQ